MAIAYNLFIDDSVAFYSILESFRLTTFFSSKSGLVGFVYILVSKF